MHDVDMNMLKIWPSSMDATTIVQYAEMPGCVQCKSAAVKVYKIRASPSLWHALPNHFSMSVFLLENPEDRRLGGLECEVDFIVSLVAVQTSWSYPW